MTSENEHLDQLRSLEITPQPPLPATAGAVFDDDFKATLAALALPQEVIDRQNAEDARRMIANNVRTFERAVGSRYARCRLSNFHCETDAQRHVVATLGATAKRITEHVRGCGGLVLFGEVGTGKDHLLAAMLYEAASRGLTVDWTNGVDLFGKVRDLIDIKGDDGKESKLVNHYRLPDVLAISDLVPPVGGPRQYSAEWLFRIVDARYREMKPTWVTVNAVNSEQAGELLTFPVVDRLKDNAVCISCAWSSYRKRLEA